MSPLSADDWMLPEPASFHARGMSRVAEIFPPASRQNSGSRALCYFYELGYPGTRWDVTPQLTWKAQLANERMPVEAIVSMDGWLVTLNNWGGTGKAHAIVVYDRHGRLVADWSGDQLFTHPTLERIARERMSTSSIWWNEKAKYYFSRANTLFINVADNVVIRIDLAGGSYRVGSQSTFRDYAAVAADANALTEVWKTSLRFSSMTDTLAARAGR
ncbi:MAG TPA: hypothetical protein VEL79_01530 [Vicinamibacterales bacterium]|nr:hypothetical protein [Vicinamibacterales bacterium]